MKNIYLFQPNYQGGSGQFVSQWLPYSIATVWSYSNQFDNIKENFIVKECYFKREKIETVLLELDNPSICFFSTYIWNEIYNLTLAEAIKRSYPNCLIVFGGPQVDEDGNTFLARNNFIDAVIINEGEKALIELLNDIIENKEIKKIYKTARINNLDVLPSPYVDTDILDNIIKKNPNTKWATTIETNRGCPFSCTFCDWGSLTHSKIKKFSLEKVFKEIDWIGDNQIEYLFIADANFGVFFERDKMIIEHLVNVKKRTGYPLNINMTWYKNSTEQVIELLLMLHEVGLNRGMTLSAQSLNDKTLIAIERKNMEVSQLGRIYEMCNVKNLNYYTEFILGMPHETFDTWSEGLCKALEYGCHGSMEIYMLELLRNSELTKQMKDHEFEVFHYEVIEKNQNSEIPEKHNYVIGSKYMPKDEFVKSWMYGWLIINFHTHGWTQIISKIANQHLKMTYKEIYDSLWEYVQMNDTFNKLFIEQKNDFENFLYIDPNVPNNFYRNDDIMPNTSHWKFHIDTDIIHDEIDAWATNLFKDIESDLLNEILKLQRLFVVKFNNREEIISKFKYNIPLMVNDKSISLQQKSKTYAFTNPIDWTDNEDFINKLYYRQRFGFTKKLIRIVD